MRGLTILVAAPDPDRFHAALSLAAANAALAGRSRIFLQGEAVGLLDDAASPRDAARAKQGVPNNRQLIAEGQALGVELVACQTGLTLCGLDATALAPEIRTAGLVHILATLEDDRLIMA